MKSPLMVTFFNKKIFCFHTRTMVIVIARALIILLFLIVGMRLMGKRTIGELQPYEFVITLAVADVVCVPMQDVSVPIVYGLIPLSVMFLVHYIITIATSKSIKFRKFINGKPFIIIDGDGINSECLTKLEIDVNDLISLIRQQGYFSIEQIAYAIIETNGKLSIMEKEDAPTPNSIPMSLIVEGKIMKENVGALNITEEQLNGVLDKNKLKIKDVLLMTADSNKLFIQPKKSKYMIVNV